MLGFVGCAMSQPPFDVYLLAIKEGRPINNSPAENPLLLRFPHLPAQPRQLNGHLPGCAAYG